MENDDLLFFIKEQYSNGEISLDQYNQMIQKLKETDPNTIKTHISTLKSQGNDLAKGGKLLEALDFYDKALEIDPEYSDVWKNKALVLKRLGKEEEAKIWSDKYNSLLNKNKMKKYIKIAAISAILVIVVGIAILSILTIEQSSPKYQTGDIISNNSQNNYGLLIRGYDSPSDKYVYFLVARSNDGNWNYINDEMAKEEGRVALETALPYKIAYVSDTSSLKTIVTPFPTTKPTLKTPTQIYSDVPSKSPISSTAKYPVGSEIQKDLNSSTYDKNYAWVIVKVNSDGTYSVGQIFYDPDQRVWFKITDELLNVRDFHAVERDYPVLLGSLDWITFPQKHYVKQPNGETTLEWDSASGSAQTTENGPSSSGTNSKTLSFSGRGDDIKAFTVQGDGGFIIAASNSGKSNFIIHITDDSGEVVEFLFNEIGPYSGKKLINLDSGDYFFEIQATGPWSISISRI